MLIFCTPFNQVILNFQISFFNAKCSWLGLQKSHYFLLVDTFDSFAAPLNLRINKGRYASRLAAGVSLSQVMYGHGQKLQANKYFHSLTLIFYR